MAEKQQENGPSEPAKFEKTLEKYVKNKEKGSLYESILNSGEIFPQQNVMKSEPLETNFDKIKLERSQEFKEIFAKYKKNNRK